MTIVIPIWVMTTLQALGITVVVILAIVGLYVITGLMSAKW